MPKNPVQFQRGYSLPMFFAHYGTEAKCRSKLFKFKWPRGFVCPQCGHSKYYLIKNRQLFQCTSCRQQTSLTSGTIFTSSKLPLTTWFMAIYLITQANEGMSALSLRRFLGISVNAAFKVKHKLQHVMKKTDDLLLLKGLVEIDDVYWGGKRGRGAPGKTPFLAAISRNEEDRPIHMRMSKLPSFTSANVEAWSRKHLDHQSIVISDMYNPFNCLSKLVAVHGQLKAFRIYDDPQNKIFHWVNTMIGNVKKAIHGAYHSVSSKHLPRCLAEFYFRFNNRFYIGSMVAHLARQAAQTQPRPQCVLKLAEE